MKQPSELNKIFMGVKNKLIAKIYKWFLDHYMEDKSVKVQMVRSEENLNRTVMMDEWEYFWRKTLKISTCVRLRENSIKMYYRWYMTPERVALMSKSKVSDRCWKSGQEKGTFYHMRWLCTKAKRYWNVFFAEIVKIFKGTIPKPLELVLLGLTLENIEISDRNAVWYLLTAARLQYAKYWKKERKLDFEFY